MLAIVLIMSGCANKVFASPSPIEVSPIIQLDIYQLQLDYSRDAAAADAIYSGKRCYFGPVRAEQVTSIFDVRGSSEDYVLVNSIKFKPVASADIGGIIQGTVFEVIGDVQGVQSGYVIVKNCWIRIVSGGRANIPSGGLY